MRKLLSTFALALTVVLLAGVASAQDAIDLSSSSIHNSPADIASWPVTHQIASVQLRPAGDPASGVALAFAPELPDSWKFFSNPGTSDNFQYTVWFCVNAGGWQCAGFVQMWQGRPSTGAAILSGWSNYWGSAGSATAGVFGSYVPQAGDTIALFASAGNARAQSGVTSVRERSNVVTVVLQAGDSGDYAFGGAQPSSPAVIPPAVSLDAAPSSTAEILAQFAALKQQQADDTAQILAAIAALKQDIHDGIRQIGDTYLPLIIKAFGTPGGK